MVCHTCADKFNWVSSLQVWWREKNDVIFSFGLFGLFFGAFGPVSNVSNSTGFQLLWSHQWKHYAGLGGSWTVCAVHFFEIHFHLLKNNYRRIFLFRLIMPWKEWLIYWRSSIYLKTPFLDLRLTMEAVQQLEQITGPSGKIFQNSQFWGKSQRIRLLRNLPFWKWLLIFILREGKIASNEGGVRVPAFISSPKYFKSSIYEK